MIDSAIEVTMTISTMAVRSLISQSLHDKDGAGSQKAMPNRTLWCFTSTVWTAVPGAKPASGTVVSPSHGAGAEVVPTVPLCCASVPTSLSRHVCQGRHTRKGEARSVEISQVISYTHKYKNADRPFPIRLIKSAMDSALQESLVSTEGLHFQRSSSEA
jgi:hypothetical protein